jgi:hypothetical protein
MVTVKKIKDLPYLPLGYSAGVRFKASESDTAFLLSACKQYPGGVSLVLTSDDAQPGAQADALRAPLS